MDGDGEGFFTDDVEGFNVVLGWEAVLWSGNIETNNITVAIELANAGNFGIPCWWVHSHTTADDSGFDRKTRFSKNNTIDGSFNDLAVGVAVGSVESWGKTKFNVGDTIVGGHFTGFIENSGDGIGLLHHFAWKIKLGEKCYKIWAVWWNGKKITNFFDIICWKFNALLFG